MDRSYNQTSGLVRHKNCTIDYRRHYYRRPWVGKRSIGWPQTRWSQDLKTITGLNFFQVAQDRGKWKILRKRHRDKFHAYAFSGVKQIKYLFMYQVYYE